MKSFLEETEPFTWDRIHVSLRHSCTWKIIENGGVLEDQLVEWRSERLVSRAHPLVATSSRDPLQVQLRTSLFAAPTAPH